MAVVGRARPAPRAARTRTTTSGQGKVEELKALLKEADANLVVADDELSPRQERNLEKALDVPVLDRTAVILDIFASHAHTAEGKLQVELAQLEYNMARMRGLWTHLERLGAGRGVGGIGTRGPGESQIETDRRLARDRITALKRRLDHVRSTRAVQRAERERAHLPSVALAGYTNAGKSTLLNALTGSTVGVRDRLFHTLDPTTRTLDLRGRTFLVTDTVGFIRKLPHQLVDAFAATLEETALADLVLHVVDASEPEEELEEMARAVEDVLEEIHATDSPRVLVLNKADALTEERRAELAFRHPDAVLVSAITRRGAGGPARADRRSSSSARCATWRCSCPTPRAARCRTCTTSRATSCRGPTPPRACSSPRGSPPCWPSATTATRSTAPRADGLAAGGAEAGGAAAVGARRQRLDRADLGREAGHEQQLGDPVAGRALVGLLRRGSRARP